MGTVATVTKLSGPGPIGDETYEGVFSLALETTDATGFQTFDMTGYFNEIYSIEVGGNDTLLDNGYLYGFVLPTVGTAIAAGTVKITVHYSPSKSGGVDAAEVFDVVNAVDLTSVGDLRIIVKGTQVL